MTAGKSYIVGMVSEGGRGDLFAAWHEIGDRIDLKCSSLTNTVTADLKSLVSQTNLAVNQANTPLGCMSEPKDGDCTGIMKHLGLPFGEQPAAAQTFFKMK
jgi:hypothetical protein